MSPLACQNERWQTTNEYSHAQVTSMVTFIQAPFKAVGEYVIEQEKTGEAKKNWLGQKQEIFTQKRVWKETGVSNCEIDGAKFAQLISAEIQRWAERGFRVLNIIPIQSGNFDYQAQEIQSHHGIFSDSVNISGGTSFGYGFSYTEGVLIHLQAAI